MESKNHKVVGQGLLEAVVALGIIMTGAVGVITLAIASLSASVQSDARIVATNLAREGIETVRNIRDTNWVRGVAWDAGLEEGGEDHPYGVIWDEEEKMSRLLARTGGIDERVSITADGLYTQERVGTPTAFFRSIVLSDICVEEGASCTRETRVGVRVRADVAWERRGVRPEIPQMRVTTDLYAWR